MSSNAALSGTFALGGDTPVHRLGFGAMRITGPGIWGPPDDIEEAKRTLARLPDLGVNFIDTAESYGPYISEELIGEVLSPYADGMVIATKSGLTRTGPNQWLQLGRPEFLRQGVMTSLRRLKLERIDLWQLHRIDPKVPADEQFDCIAQMQKAGLIKHAGLSEVNVAQIEQASRYFKVASVQNRFNLTDRKSAAVLEHCTKNDIGFIPWAPLQGSPQAMETMARQRNVTPGQLSLAWLLKLSPVMLPIPGTGKVRHLEENVSAAGIELSADDMAALGR